MLRAMTLSGTQTTPGWRTWANALTLVRLAVAPVLAAALLTEAALAAGLLFALACATDFADGPLARRLGQATRRGALLDHAVDAIFCTTGLAALALRGNVPALLPGLVALAFAQYVADSRALAGRTLRASALGRSNGIAYYVLLGIPVVRDALGLGWPGHAFVRAAGWALVATTLVSMTDRAWTLLRPAP